MIYFNKLIDICINRQESQKVVNNYFDGTNRIKDSWEDCVCNYQNGYYPEGTVATEMGDIPVKVLRDRNEEIESDLVPKYSRTVNEFDEKVISMYALGMSDN